MTCQLILATQNPHKVRELRDMVEVHNLDISVHSPRDFGEPPEIPEVHDTFAANAIDKARGIADWIAGLAREDIAGRALVVADDSGLCVDAFDGAPGVYSARFSDGGDVGNNQKLVCELQARGLKQSPAHYECVIAVVRVDGSEVFPEMGSVWIATGSWHGVARTEARGSGGFGYDPHIYVPRHADTDTEGPWCAVAELPPEHKRERSHRGRAMAQLLSALAKPVDTPHKSSIR